MWYYTRLLHKKSLVCCFLLRLTNYMKPTYQTLIGFIGTIALCSCTVGPDFVSPSPIIKQTYTSKSTSQFGNQHIELNKKTSLTWWKEFHSATLNGLMEQGIKRNYSLTAMRESLAQAKELVSASQGQLWPQAGVNAGIGRQQYGPATFGPVNLRIEPFSYYQIGPNASYTLDVFGGTRRTIEKQKALALYQQHELDAAFLTLTGNIATTSLTIATIKARIDVLKDIIQDDKKNLQLIQKSFTVGSSSRSDVLSAQSQLTNDETLLPSLYQQLHVAQNELNVLLGTIPTHSHSLIFHLKDFTLPKKLPLELPSELAHKRPDILAAEASLHAASADIGIATAHLYPNITLSATLLQEGVIPGAPLSISPNAWSLLGNLTTPIFSGGTLRAQRRASIHAYQSAFAQYQEIVLKAFYQVSNLLYALKHDAEELALQKKAMLTAKESLRIARLSFTAGVVGVLEVLDAERLYAQSRLGYVNAQAQRYQDTIQLYLALGGGLHP
ncbi:efflux transporter outer membrane subunit [Legionella bozemanae]|uniref:efflux transporter outer membrane subunit n=2 Tax=Legionella bozemanae TaxID=447 RepID=UPI00399CAFED